MKSSQLQKKVRPNLLRTTKGKMHKIFSFVCNIYESIFILNFCKSEKKSFNFILAKRRQARIQEKESCNNINNESNKEKEIANSH